jgi:hypothetical protein
VSEAGGFLIVDPSAFTIEQVGQLLEKSDKHGGWRHPDKVRWIIPVIHPKYARDEWLKGGWPANSVEIAS